MNPPVIEINNLTKRYGDFTAVDNLSLTINKGEVFGLLGPNGAGKSTTILMMLGLTEPTAGQVTVCGINSATNPIDVKRKVGYLPDDIGFYENYTGLDNLLYTARLNRIPEKEAKERAARLLERVGLSAEINKKAGKYSRGMRQRLGLADVLIKNPEVIVLDEPTLGIDPKGVREFLNLIIQLSREESITVLLSSHHLHQVQQVCDRVGLFVNGKLLAEGNLSKLSAQLFPNENLIVNIKAGFKTEATEQEKLRLADIIKSIPEVNSVSYKEDMFQISCSSRITSKIAKTVIENGFDLLHLTQKSYGLDEIYHLYFEEQNSNGKVNKQ